MATACWCACKAHAGGASAAGFTASSDYTHLFGTMASPEVPAFVLMFLGWAFGALLIAAFLLLAIDLLGVVGRFYPGRRGMFC
nr:hypothetical protein KXZ65_01910 [Pectobacterium sp. PL152]